MPLQIRNLLCHNYDFQNILLKLETVSVGLSQTLIGYGSVIPFQIRNLCHNVDFQNILLKLEICHLVTDSEWHFKSVTNQGLR